MSAQNDIISGVDLSAVSSITQENLMQAINQAAPLDNIGFVIVSTTRPDITNNPRFIRYIWLDISNPANPTFKRYIGDRTTLQDADAYWTALGVTDLAVLTSMMAARSATGGINVGLMKLNADYSASPASAGYLLRVAANGKDIEVVAVNTAVTGLAQTSLDTTGLTAGKFLGYNGGVWGAVPIVPSTDLIGAARLALETNLLPSTARFVARTNAAGTAPEWVTPNDIFNDGELTLAKISSSGASALYGIRRNSLNTANEWGQIIKTYSSTQTLLAASTKILDEVHSLGGIPDGYSAYILCTTSDGDYVANTDYIDHAVLETGGGVRSLQIGFTSSNCFAICGPTMNVLKRVTATIGGQFQITPGSWKLVIRAWRFNI